MRGRLNARALRRRRRAYARRSRFGFEGYVVGSGTHLFQALLWPMLLAAGVSLVTTWWLIRAGASSLPVVVVAVTCLVLALAVGLGRFRYDVRKLPRPRPGPPGATGVREPRRPPPGSGQLGATRELPGGSVPSQP